MKLSRRRRINNIATTAYTSVDVYANTVTSITTVGATAAANVASATVASTVDRSEEVYMCEVDGVIGVRGGDGWIGEVVWDESTEVICYEV